MPRKILYELSDSGNTWTRKEENCIERDLFCKQSERKPCQLPNA